MGIVIQFPPELLIAICAQVYSSGLPAPVVSLDPLILTDYGIPTALPSAVPSANWSEPLARRTLASLCLVNHGWYAAAKPWLWRKVEVRLPRSWLSVVEEIAWDDNAGATTEQSALAVENSIRAAAGAAVASRSLSRDPADKEAALKLEESIVASLKGPDSPIPLELLSPPASRDPSPSMRRLRQKSKSKSPARWKIMRTISDAVRNVMERSDPGVYVPIPHDPHPGRFVRHLDFNHFRTIGMRRSVEEGVNSRFVTGDRIRAVLKEMTNLTAFGATEYMDGALTLPVLNELFLRGAPSQGRGRRIRVRGLNNDTNDNEDEDRERRAECKDLEAVDLTGCVSAVFVNALTEFVTAHLLLAESESNNGEDDDRRERRTRFARTPQEEPLVFPGLQRLGLRGVKSIVPSILSPFILAFPSLTHLDLSGTRATPELLSALGQSPTVRLHSLALARCIKLTSASIRNFLVESPVTAGIRELSLYGDMTFVSPLTEEHLWDIFSLAPCFTSGELVYLDVSSSPVTKRILAEACPPQRKLRSLGLSYIPDLELRVIADFLCKKASNVEVLTIASTSPELDCGLRVPPPGFRRGSPRQASIALHRDLITPLCTPPFSFSLSATPAPQKLPLTALRVLELSTPLLGGLGAGASSWRIVRSKGGRGWYVDTSCGWVADGAEGSVLKRNLPREHGLRSEMDKMADANGNVNSGVGWHARKMEILHGNGMLGREDGLYGAVSFAYQG